MTKKILLCTPFDLSKGSGIARCSHHILEYYQKLKLSEIELEILSMDRSTYISYESSFFTRIYKGIIDYFSIIKKIRTKAKTGHYDAIHIASSAHFSLLKDLLCIKILRKLNVPTIIHFHFGRIPEIIEKNGWEWKLMKKVAKFTTQIIVIDQTSYDVLTQQGITNVDYLPNPLSPKTENLANQHNSLSRSRNTVLFVGHILKTKGIYELINACGMIPDVELKILGVHHGNVKEELLSLANNYRPNNWVRFMGNVSEETVIKEMCQCAVFVLPTYTEGFPNVILESMVCGCPIVTTNVGAIPEMLDIRNGNNNGICISPQNEQDLRNAILHMLNNPEYAKSCGENARRRVIEMYSMPVIWSKMCEIWEKLPSRTL